MARGRPKIGNRVEIAAAALRLMARQGWPGTTMANIAEVAGLSVPTLFRYFPTKADILWHGMDDNANEFWRLFASYRSRGQGAVADAYLSMLKADIDSLPVLKMRGAILGNDRAAAEASWGKFEDWQDIVTRMVEVQRPELSKPERIMDGAMVWVALRTAFTAWAVSSEASPDKHIQTARKRISVLGY